MTITLKPCAEKDEIDQVCRTAKTYGLKPKIVYGRERIMIALIGNENNFPFDKISNLPSVEYARPVSKPYKYVSNEINHGRRKININDVEIGGSELVIMAGPCSVENYESTLRIARDVKEAGAHIFRAGAYKPRTSPHTFQGLREKGLDILKDVKRAINMPVITEVLDVRDIEKVGEVADIYQVGTRNMQNYPLLDELGRAGKPVLLKRGMSATLEEWLLSAERIVEKGNEDVILCERGIRTFETAYRNVMDVNGIAMARLETYLPIIADPSHGTGNRKLVYSASGASVAAGADGLLIETHYDPDNAWTDRDQVISIRELKEIMRYCKNIRNMRRD